MLQIIDVLAGQLRIGWIDRRIVVFAVARCAIVFFSQGLAGINVATGNRAQRNGRSDGDNRAGQDFFISYFPYFCCA